MRVNLAGGFYTRFADNRELAKETLAGQPEARTFLRGRLTAQMQTIEEDLTAAADFFNSNLDLIEDPLTVLPAGWVHAGGNRILRQFPLEHAGDVDDDSQ